MSKEVNEERTPRTVEDAKEMLVKHSNGEIQRTIQNCITILQNDHAEALGNTNIPAEWETRAICEIMNTGISRGDIQGWQAHKTAKRYPKYGVQKGWERVTSPETGAEDFSEITDAEAKQLGFPF